MMIPEQEANADGKAVPETFAQLIERRLKEEKITQVELQARSGVADTSWARWRAGALPSRVYVKLAAPALDVPVERLQTLVDDERRMRAGVVIDTPIEAQAWIDTKAPANAEQGV